MLLILQINNVLIYYIYLQNCRPKRTPKFIVTDTEPSNINKQVYLNYLHSIEYLIYLHFNLYIEKYILKNF